MGIDSADYNTVTADDIYIATTWLCRVAAVGQVRSVTAAAWKGFCVY